MTTDFTKLADLIDAFADEQDAFSAAAHRADYNSSACHQAYERQENARKAMADEIRAILHSAARDLSSVLRACT